MITYVALIIVAIFSILLIMPLNFWLCNKIGLIDKPDSRKVHKEVKLRGGGISLYIVFLPFLLILFLINHSNEVLAVIVSSFILFVTGVLDDKYSLNAKVKLLLQITSASTAFFMGIQITKMNTFGLEFNTITSFVVTVFWIILLINAINLIDGLDGLASGVGIIVLSVVMVVSADSDITRMIAIFVIGMLIGFLKFNFFPSRIFLGDTGSMFIGYIIAILSITGVGKTAVSVTTILILVSFPLLDVALAIIRRMMNKQPIFSPDKNHMHHCFMNKGYSHKHSVLMIYLTNVIFAFLAYISVIFSTYQLIHIVIFVGYIGFTIFLIKYLQVLPIKERFSSKFK